MASFIVISSNSVTVFLNQIKLLFLCIFVEIGIMVKLKDFTQRCSGLISTVDKLLLKITIENLNFFARDYTTVLLHKFI